jgi:hypothetical protein
MTASDVAIGAVLVVWVASFVAPLAFSSVHIDASVSLVLMALAGAIIVFRQRQEDVRSNDGR